MNNHVHLIVSALERLNLSSILRDFIRYTSKQILLENENNPRESGNKWMIWVFRSSGTKNSNNRYYQFGRIFNYPLELVDNRIIDQRLHYIHNNPVVERIVDEPEYYVY